LAEKGDAVAEDQLLDLVAVRICVKSTRPVASICDEQPQLQPALLI
jgi:hypothetical protein